MKKALITGKLSALCEAKGITIYRLAQMTKIDRNWLYMIDRDDMSNATAKVMNSIYEATKKEFGEGFKPSQYLGHSCFSI